LVVAAEVARDPRGPRRHLPCAPRRAGRRRGGLRYAYRGAEKMRGGQEGGWRPCMEEAGAGWDRGAAVWGIGRVWERSYARCGNSFLCWSLENREFTISKSSQKSKLS
jgi:hypothetical protein